MLSDARFQPEPRRPSMDEVFPLGDGVADTEAGILCPWCSERLELTLDPGNGPVQEYVEDCEVCCSPMVLSVRYAADGRARVRAARER